jgi:hypothetical protein
MDQLAEARRRGGGYDWSLMQDAAEPDRYVETWREASWIQHLRHHERVSKEDQIVQDSIHRLQINEKDPVITHLVAPSSQ